MDSNSDARTFFLSIETVLSSSTSSRSEKKNLKFWPNRFLSAASLGPSALLRSRPIAVREWERGRGRDGEGQTAPVRNFLRPETLARNQETRCRLARRHEPRSSRRHFVRTCASVRRDLDTTATAFQTFHDLALPVSARKPIFERARWKTFERSEPLNRQWILLVFGSKLIRFMKTPLKFYDPSEKFFSTSNFTLIHFQQHPVDFMPQWNSLFRITINSSTPYFTWTETSVNYYSKNFIVDIPNCAVVVAGSLEPSFDNIPSSQVSWYFTLIVSEIRSQWIRWQPSNCFTC